MMTHDFARLLLEQPNENMRGRGIDQLWIDTIAASRDAAKRERDILRKELEKLKSS